MNKYYHSFSLDVNGKTIFALCILLLSAIATTQLNNKNPVSEKTDTESNEPIPEGIIGFGGFTDLETKDPEKALKVGIKGYITIHNRNYTETISLNKGESANFTLVIKFVSYVPEITSTYVTIDPSLTPSIEQGDVNLGDYVTYMPDGKVVIRAGGKLFVTMTVAAPSDHGIYNIPFGAVGIRSPFEIIDYT